MTIKARGKSWQATIHYKGQRFRKQFKEYKDAEVWEAESTAALLKGKKPQLVTTNLESLDQKPQTLGQLIQYTFKNEWIDRKTSKYLLRNAEMIGCLIGFDVPIEKIDTFKINDVVLKLQQQGNSNATINRKLAALSKCFTTAISLDILNKKPRIKRLKEAVHRIRWYSDEELQKMFDYCVSIDEERFGHWIRFQADTGLRCSETNNLLWEDIQDNKKNTYPIAVLSETKNQSPRGVPLSKKAWEAVEFMKNLSVDSAGPFAFAKPFVIKTTWAKVRHYMGWDEDRQTVPHALRHTFCSRLVQRGVPLLTVKELAGHKQMDVTLRYAHLAPHNLVEAISLFN